MAHYPDSMTVQDGLQQYFAENNFGPDGGYEKPSVPIKIGPFTMNLPNTEARKRAVKRHDIHHLVTGYETHFLGEAEIAAWELASGCRDYYAAWILNGMALAVGIFMNPLKMLRAYQRGWQSKNLYSEADLVPILNSTLGEVKALLQVPEP